MQMTDLAAGMKLSTAENWNQTESDWKLLIEDPENICLVAEQDGKIIGSTTAINYANEVAWIGMVLVDKEFRGRGISKALLTQVFEKLGSRISVKLDATPDGQRVYEKFDFKEEYRIARLTSVSCQPTLPDFSSGVKPEPVLPENLPGIIALDEQIFGANRTSLIKSLLNEYPDKAWLLKRNHAITGFALGRRGNRYRQIGPVMASTLTDAKILIVKALEELTGQHVLVDVLCDQAELHEWLLSKGFVEQRHFIRMYRGEKPHSGLTSRQFLIAGPEFG
jgi:hypothetical protein